MERKDNAKNAAAPIPERERKAPRVLLFLCCALYEDDRGRVTVSSEIEMKLTWGEALHVAQNRNKWRGIVVVLYPTGDEEDFKVIK